MLELNEDNWIQIANKYNYKWQLPNCLGAFDGKHVAICKYVAIWQWFWIFQLQRYHSISLMAHAGANYRFFQSMLVRKVRKIQRAMQTCFRVANLGKWLNQTICICIYLRMPLLAMNRYHIFYRWWRFSITETYDEAIQTKKKRIINARRDRLQLSHFTRKALCRKRIWYFGEKVVFFFGWKDYSLQTGIRKESRCRLLPIAYCIISWSARTHNFLIPEMYRDLTDDKNKRLYMRLLRDYICDCWETLHDRFDIRYLRKLPSISEPPMRKFFEILFA